MLQRNWGGDEQRGDQFLALDQTARPHFVCDLADDEGCQMQIGWERRSGGVRGHCPHEELPKVAPFASPVLIDNSDRHLRLRDAAPQDHIPKSQIDERGNHQRHGNRHKQDDWIRIAQSDLVSSNHDEFLHRE